MDKLDVSNCMVWDEETHHNIDHGKKESLTLSGLSRSNRKQDPLTSRGGERRGEGGKSREAAAAAAQRLEKTVHAVRIVSKGLASMGK